MVSLFLDKSLQRPQSSSASRFTAGAFGFLTFTQCGERPDRYIEPSRFDTMPSQTQLQASSAAAARVGAPRTIVTAGSVRVWENQCCHCGGCDDDEIGRQRYGIDFLFAPWPYRSVHVCPPLPGTHDVGAQWLKSG